MVQDQNVAQGALLAARAGLGAENPGTINANQASRRKSSGIHGDG